MVLNNKLALITGGAKGIGRTICLELAANGCDLIIHYNSSKDAALSLKDEVEKLGRTAWLVQTDFSDVAQIQAFFPEQIVPLLEFTQRKIDLIVNNAGVSGFTTHRQINDDTFNRFFTINVKAPLQIMKDAYPHVREGGKIVNISSTTAKNPVEKMIIYGASKAALENVTQSFVRVYGKKNVTVNIIAPGLIETDFEENDTMSKVVKDYMIRQSPIKRLGTPEDVAGVIVFIASGLSNWVNAQRIEVTGGLSY